MIPNMLLNQKATICEYEGHCAFGATYSEPKVIRCRWEPIFNRSKGDKADSTLTQVQLFCNPTVNLTVNSKVTLEGLNYVVESVEFIPGLFGDIDHLEVVLNGCEC